MSIRLRVHSSQARRPTFQKRSRTLITTSNPPQSPAAHVHSCEAIDTDEQPCETALLSEEHHWCSRHAQDLEDLNRAWEKIQREAERIEVRDVKSAEQRMLKMQLAVGLRRRLRERFHNGGVDTADYTGWIAAIERDTKALADTIRMSHTEGSPLPEVAKSTVPYLNERTFQDIAVIQSGRSPGKHTHARENVPDDGTILVLKRFQANICEEGIRRLYSIVPDLDDSPQSPDSPLLTQVDLGAEIMRAWFRIMVLNDSEAEVLEYASRSQSISEFLRGCKASQIEVYCDYFHNAWRPYAVQYLRVAVCAQTLAGGDKRMINLLGGTIPSSMEGLRMTKPAWDILYRWLPNLLTPRTVGSICSNFEDYVTICKLLMLGLYHGHWYDSESILGECSTGIYLGFVPISKSIDLVDYDSTHERGEHVHSETRNWLCGQMKMGDPFTADFLEEIRRRTNRLLLVVYQGTSSDATVHLADTGLFISRYRSATTREGLHDAKWTTTMTLEDIKNQLRTRKTSMYDPVVEDSWQFIIIDRDVGQPFELLDIVQDALLMLVGDPTPRQVAKRVVRSVVPASLQDRFLEEMTIESSPELRCSPPHEVQYDGNRFRCHDPSRDFVMTRQRNITSHMLTRDDNRLIRRVCEDMERCGIISLIPEYVEPQTKPVIVLGTDGALDLYFPYEQNEPDNGQRTSPLPFPLNPTSSLLDFAQAFKQQHPTGILAKGSIHTHYCAWPMPAMRSLGDFGSNFATPEGHIYHWNAMPFDRQWSSHAWQYYIQHHINSKYPFVMFHLTTFLICALDECDAENKIATLLDETEDRGWRINLPRIRDWTVNVEDLKLGVLYSGVRPADEL